MATHECAGTIADRVRPGPDRLVLQMPSHVVCELRRRLVAARGLDLEGSQEDVVQVAGELARESRVADRGARSHDRALRARSIASGVRFSKRRGLDASEQLVETLRRASRCPTKSWLPPPDLLGAGIARRQRRSDRVVGGSDISRRATCRCRSRGAWSTPPASTRMLPGFRSRWTMKLRCA